MKRIKLIFTLSLVVFLFSTCDDTFLDSFPKNTKTESTFFKTEQEVYQILVGCYEGMYEWLNNGGNWVYPIVSDIMSDDASGGAGKSDYLLPQAIDRFDISIAPAEGNIYLSTWGSAFTTVARCNAFLKRFNDLPWNDNSVFAKQKLMTQAGSYGEVLFIRAYIYFCSMQMWGHLPLITEKTVDPGTESMVDPKLVYELIVKDLQTAIKNLPATNSFSTSNFSGRITKYAAEALLARVYLYYTGYYGKTQVELPRVNKSELLTYMGNILKESEVKTYLTDVIQNSGHDLIPDFNALWPAGATATGVQYAGEYNKEVVFAIKHGYVTNTQMKWVSDMGARAFPMPPYGRGWGFDIGNKSLWDAWDSNDNRKVASLMNVLEEKNTMNNGNLYNDVAAGLDVREYQSLFLKKYLREINATGGEIYGLKIGNPSAMNSFTDYIVIRYSDVLLMAAELGIDAQVNFDKVRNRAYGGTALQKAATFENIMDERRMEFVGESLRYWDLLRRGVEYTANAVKIDPPGVPVRNGAFIYGSNNIVIKAERVMATFGLSQIPEQEITLSEGRLLTQNEGWTR